MHLRVRRKIIITDTGTDANVFEPGEDLSPRLEGLVEERTVVITNGLRRGRPSGPGRSELRL